MLPILLVLYNPEEDLLIYASIKDQLSAGGPLRIPKTNVFSKDSRGALIEIAKEPDRILAPAEVLKKFKAIRLERSASQVITGIEFLLASIDRQGRYFSLRICRIKTVFEILATDGMLGIGQPDFDYILRCSLECEGLKLTETFIAEFNEIWFGMEMVHDLEVPLTKRGIEVLEYLWTHLPENVSVDAFAEAGRYQAGEIAIEIAESAQNESDRYRDFDELGKVRL